jgi:hypothetical protein
MSVLFTLRYLRANGRRTYLSRVFPNKPLGRYNRLANRTKPVVAFKKSLLEWFTTTKRKKTTNKAMLQPSGSASARTGEGTLYLPKIVLCGPL